MRSRHLFLFAAWITLLLPSAASATLLEMDLFAAGDRLVTRDTETGLDWLDLYATALAEDQLPPTVNWGQIIFRSYDWIAASSWYQEGWRHATAAEICELFASHALAPDPCPGGEISEESDATHQLVSLLGWTYYIAGYGSFTAEVDGQFGGPPDPATGRTSVAHLSSRELQYPSVTDGSWARVSEGIEVDNTYGHFLVRPVPEPSTALLLAAGLAGLAATRWCRSPR
jgi:hypothetical protein